MTGAATGKQKERPAASRDHSSDEQLIGRCLKADQEAWSALLDKYKNLIYSIPIKLGMHQDAGDIFQSVCVDLLSDLPRLREHRALPKWLMQTCYHKCLSYQRAASRVVELAPEGTESNSALPASSVDELPEHMRAQLEQEPRWRDDISGVPDNGERMVRQHRFDSPPRPYEAVAE